MVHPLVEQLRFTRSEWVRGLDSVTQEEGAHQFGVMNSIGWIVGHLAWQEQSYWLTRAQNTLLVESVLQCGFGQPRCNPSLDAMWEAWHNITDAADPYLDTLTTDLLLTRYQLESGPHRETIGTMLHRMIYHYWYHLGEALAIRQMLGHTDLPQFVGNLSQAPYQPDSGK